MKSSKAAKHQAATVVSMEQHMKGNIRMDQHRGRSQSAPKRRAEPPSVAEIINSGDPFSVLGPHEISPGQWEIRAILPDADAVTVLDRDGQTVLSTMERMPPDGLLVASLRASGRPDYRLRIERQGCPEIRHDAYSFGAFLSHDDLMRISDPTSDAVYTKLGAHFLDLGGIQGFLFTVWAPNARRVSVVGDFNSWDGRCHHAGSALQVRDHWPSRKSSRSQGGSHRLCRGAPARNRFRSQRGTYIRLAGYGLDDIAVGAEPPQGADVDL